MNQDDAILDFWNSRSNLGELAGTNDFMLTRIEQQFIADVIPHGSHVLDIGCGNALSLVRLAQEKDCSGIGIDFSEGMVKKSREFVDSHGLSDKVYIYQNSVPPVPIEYGTFDVVLTNRSLINLTSTGDQKKAVQEIGKIVRPGGMYLMIECSNDGAEFTNFFRKKLDLEPIEAPWHNLFFNEKEVESWQTDTFKIEQFLHISSTYNFLSRVVYAKHAEVSGEPLVYDSLINKISLDLPQQIGEFGPVKAWIWRKSDY
jgi:ubiquinone/menaquinone biosynthesis C-methylase UbiE